MPRGKRAILSIALVLISFSCFYFAPPTQKKTISHTVSLPSGGERTEKSEFDTPGIVKFLEWLGIGALVLAAWLWRKELGVTQLGPLGGAEPPVSQQPAGTPSKSPDESAPPPKLDLTAVQREMADHVTKQRLDHIMKMFQKVHSVNVMLVAHKLGISTDNAKTLLYLLTKNGQLRADGFPRQTIYTPASSVENLILDAVRRKLSETHGVLSERRYVRIKRLYEVDSLIQCEGITFVIEAKILRTSDLLSRLDKWILQLLNVTKEFPPQRIACILAIGCLGGIDVAAVKEQAASFTFDSAGVPVQIMAFSETELTK